MRALLTGARELRRAPLAALPIVTEAVVAGLLVIGGGAPAEGAGAAVVGVFPFDVYWDVKQALAYAQGWEAFAGAALLSVLVRGGVLGSTLWLLDGREGPVARAWGRAGALAAVAVLAFVPVAALMFTGVALRYAPFVWVAGALGFLACVPLARRGLRIDAGAGVPRGHGLPEAGTLLTYAFFLSALAASMAAASRGSAWLSAALIVAAAPLHAAFLAGWRRDLRAETYRGGGALVSVTALLAIAALLGSSLYDRYIRDSPPVGDAMMAGTLLLLGGADSTSTTGALTALDPRDLGFDRRDAALLSYAGAGEPYEGRDTRVDLERSAALVAEQVANVREDRGGRVYVVGHSQAALILDRMIAAGLAAPDRSVVISAPPVSPPPVGSPPSGASAPGTAGADAARFLAWAWALAGWDPYDIDAPASPTNLGRVVAPKQPPRLSVWAVADSVWLDGDHRRPGEATFTVWTDHVGAVNNARAVAAARSFLGRRTPQSQPVLDAAVGLLRYAFEPWRP